MMEFFENAPVNQRIAFLTAIAHLARSDGDFDDDEKDFFIDLAKLYKLSKDEARETIKIRNDQEVLDIVSQITNRGLALVLIREMFYLGYEDGDLSDAEIIFISKVGMALDISIDKMEEISSWVIRGIEWEEEGDELFYDVEEEDEAAEVDINSFDL